MLQLIGMISKKKKREGGGLVALQVFDYLKKKLELLIFHKRFHW